MRLGKLAYFSHVRINRLARLKITPADAIALANQRLDRSAIVTSQHDGSDDRPCQNRHGDQNDPRPDLRQAAQQIRLGHDNRNHQLPPGAEPKRPQAGPPCFAFADEPKRVSGLLRLL